MHACWMLDVRYGALLQRYFSRACTLSQRTFSLKGMPNYQIYSVIM